MCWRLRISATSEKRLKKEIPLTVINNIFTLIRISEATKRIEGICRHFEKLF